MNAVRRRGLQVWRLFGVALLFALLSAGTVFGQNTPPAHPHPHPPSQPMPGPPTTIGNAPASEPIAMDTDGDMVFWKHAQAKERQKHVNSDVERMLAIALALKAEADKDAPATKIVAKDAAELEKLAKDMKNQLVE